MRIGIVGSRTFEDYSVMSDFIKSNITLGVNDIVVSGGAIGADSLAERFARDNNLKIKIYLPEWNRFGNNAGMIRNGKIVEESDIIFAFWNGRSKGTADTIEKARRKNVPVHVYNFVFNLEKIAKNNNG